MGIWIKGPRRYSWPAGRSSPPKAPLEAATPDREEAPAKPKRVYRRKTKKAE